MSKKASEKNAAQQILYSFTQKMNYIHIFIIQHQKFKIEVNFLDRGNSPKVFKKNKIMHILIIELEQPIFEKKNIYNVISSNQTIFFKFALKE